jgi:prepilin peptidase CpaA
MDQFADIVNSFSVAAFAATLLLAAISDYRRLEIPNWMSIAVTLLFVPAALGAGLTFFSLATHMGVGLALLVLGAGAFALGLTGGGDVKLLAATGIWFGLDSVGFLLLGVVMAGGTIGLMILVALRVPRIMRMLGSPAWIDPDGGMKQPMPYGIAITIAGIALIDYMPVAPHWISIWGSQ